MIEVDFMELSSRSSVDGYEAGIEMRSSMIEARSRLAEKKFRASSFADEPRQRHPNIYIY
ncbi:hypothetical protein MUP77_01405 [Candidatus Bathyarchaeota archaeon]|jgi:hypothetical protein|nr:hypothetical protein [Candidatus Bathyarchaeota archaeon]